MAAVEGLVPRTVHVHVEVGNTIYILPMDGYYNPATDEETVRPERSGELLKVVNRLGGTIKEQSGMH